MLGDGMRRRQAGGTSKQVERSERAKVKARGRTRPVKWGVIIPATLGALLIPFGVGYALAVFVLFPKPKIEGGGGVVVPNLVGRTVAEAEEMLTTAGLGAMTTIELPSPDANSGDITAQDPLAGQQLRAGSGVRVSVSGGRARIKVPDVDGLTFEAASQILRRLGFDITQVDESSLRTAGRVARLDPVAGTALQLPATVTVVVSTGPRTVDSLTVPVAPDTLVQHLTR